MPVEHPVKSGNYPRYFRSASFWLRSETLGFFFHVILGPPGTLFWVRPPVTFGPRYVDNPRFTSEIRESPVIPCRMHRYKTNL